MTASIAPCSRYLPPVHDPETIPERHPARIAEREASLLCPPANGLHHQGLDAAPFAEHFNTPRGPGSPTRRGWLRSCPRGRGCSSEHQRQEEGWGGKRHPHQDRPHSVASSPARFAADVLAAVRSACAFRAAARRLARWIVAAIRCLHGLSRSGQEQLSSPPNTARSTS